MKYVIAENKKEDRILGLLSNRGVSNPQKYISKNKEIQSYGDLFNIEIGVRTLLKSIFENKKIGVVVDEDSDGITSASILYSFLKKSFPNIDLVYFIHSSPKAHGIDADIIEQSVSAKINLLLVPDAGSGDDKTAKELKDKGIEVISIDHHPCDKNPKNMILINPFISPDYKNKMISGTGVTYQFMKAIDNESWSNQADYYLDLVALSIISDSCDVREIENRAFLDIGLSNVKNKALLAFIEKAEYGDKKIESLKDFSFSIIPLINAMVRSGNIEEKSLMFRAFAEEDEFFEYQKRNKEIIQEDIYTRMVRLCVNSKGRQDRLVDKALDLIEKDIVENNRNKNKLLFALVDDEVDRNLTGLCAIKIANKYMKPTFIIRKGKNDYFSGSGRNFDSSPISNLKDFMQSLGSIAFASGHQSAFGIGMTKKQLISTLEISNEKLKNYDFSKVYSVDFEIDVSSSEMDVETFEIISEIISMKNYWGQGLPEPLLLLKNVVIDSRKISFMGEKRDTWKVALDNGEELIKFKCNEDDLVSMDFRDGDSWNEKRVVVNAIAKVGKSSFNGEEKVQYVIQDYEVQPS